MRHVSRGGPWMGRAEQNGPMMGAWPEMAPSHVVSDARPASLQIVTMMDCASDASPTR